MEQWDSGCPYSPSSEPTAEGTGSGETAGKEDPIFTQWGWKYHILFVSSLYFRGSDTVKLREYLCVLGDILTTPHRAHVTKSSEKSLDKMSKSNMCGEEKGYPQLNIP